MWMNLFFCFCLSYLVEIRRNGHDLMFMFIVVYYSFWYRAKITWYNIIWSAIIKKVYNIHGSPELVRLTHKHLSLHANCQFICQHFKSMTLKATPFLCWNKINCASSPIVVHGRKASFVGHHLVRFDRKWMLSQQERGSLLFALLTDIICPFLSPSILLTSPNICLNIVFI